MQIPYRRADGPLNLLVDSTGITFFGDGAYDTRRCHTAILERDADPFVGRSVPRTDR